MPIEIIEYNNKEYPAFQAQGFAAQFAFPFAEKLCRGVGYDIGCNRKEWALPAAIPVDPAMGTEYDAMNLPPLAVDFIFSSHCLEHLSDWVGVLDYWATKLRSGGVMFLYLPHPTQEYWLPFNNRKHLHCLYPEALHKYFEQRQWKHIFVSSYDLNNSFYVVAERP